MGNWQKGGRAAGFGSGGARKAWGDASELAVEDANTAP